MGIKKNETFQHSFQFPPLLRSSGLSNFYNFCSCCKNWLQLILSMECLLFPVSPVSADQGLDSSLNSDEHMGQHNLINSLKDAVGRPLPSKITSVSLTLTYLPKTPVVIIPCVLSNIQTNDHHHHHYHHHHHHHH